MGSHLIDGEFQSDKYPTTPRGKVPLSVEDPTAQDLLWEYAQRRRSVNAEFSSDLEASLVAAGYVHTDPGARVIDESERKMSHVHIRGVYGDGGENEGVLSVTAVLDASPHYPECGGIIVGSPSKTPLIDGYIPDLGGFSCGPEGAERLIRTLQNAARDFRAGLAAWKPST